MLTVVLRSHVQSRAKRGVPPVVTDPTFPLGRRHLMAWRAVLAVAAVVLVGG